MGFGLAALNRLASAPMRSTALACASRPSAPSTKARARLVSGRGRCREPRSSQRSAGSRQGRAARPRPPSALSLFDLTPTDEQQMIVAATAEFAAEQLRPAAAGADTDMRGAGGDPEALDHRTRHHRMVGRPGGASAAWPASASAVTGALVAEVSWRTATWDCAVACLAPAAVSNALVLFGNADQQSHLPVGFRGR